MRLLTRRFHISSMFTTNWPMSVSNRRRYHWSTLRSMRVTISRNDNNNDIFILIHDHMSSIDHSTMSTSTLSPSLVATQLIPQACQLDVSTWLRRYGVSHVRRLTMATRRRLERVSIDKAHRLTAFALVCRARNGQVRFKLVSSN